MSLRARIALLVAIAVAGLTAAGGFAFLHQLQVGLDASLDRALQARADALIQRLGPDGQADFQDSGKTGLLPPAEALAQVIGARGALLDSSEGARGRALLAPAQLAQARARPFATTSAISDGTSVRLLAVPVRGSGTPPTVVVVGTSRSLSLQAVDRVREGLLIGGLIALALGGTGAWLLAGSALRPVERMRREAALISAVDTTARLAVPNTKDEVARLGETMNGLLERLQRAISQQRNFVADAGHELRTPLTVLRTELDLAARAGRSPEYLHAAVRRSSDEADRLIRLAEDLLLLAREDNPDALLMRGPVRLGEVVQEAILAAKARADAAGVQIVEPDGSHVVLSADRDRLRQVIDNLLDNALRFAPPASTVTVRLAQADESKSVRLEVLDHGPGFPTEFLPHAFERFRRADESRQSGSVGGAGTGLGLAIVASLVHAHGGTVTASNRAAGGAWVSVELPIPKM